MTVVMRVLRPEEIQDFSSTGLLIRNPAGTYEYTITAGAITANRALTIPVITGTDTLMTLGLAQTMTGALTLPNTGLHVLDTNASHDLVITPGSDLTADRILTLTTGDAARTITLSGNPTLADWFDQAVKAASSPTFANLTITSFAADWTNAGRTVADAGTLSTVVINAGTITGITDITVADGGTGRSTSTTAYALLAAGTTATGAHQTLAAGATTEILVGGGAAALPVWTTATGSGAPVRATSPALVTPALGTPTALVLTSATGLPAAAVLAGSLGTGAYVMDSSLQVSTVELGHATDTTLARVSAGLVSIEGVNILMNGGALGTPASGTVTNLTGTASININGTVGAGTPAAGIFTKVEATGDTATGDNAAMGYTAAEGLILTGQGSSNDITFKNDADAEVAHILTGTTYFEFLGPVNILGGDLAVTRAGSGVGVYTQVNNSSTGANSGAILLIRVDGTDAGSDPYIQFERTVGTNINWVFGMDNSNTQAMVWSDGLVLGTNDRMRLVKASGVLSVDGDGGGSDDPVSLFDDYDDVQELQRFAYTSELAVERGIVTPAQRTANRNRMVGMGVAEWAEQFEGPDRLMLHVQPMMRLLAGGIYQTRAMLEETCMALAERVEVLERKALTA